MSRTFIRQETQIKNSDTYADNVALGSTMESAPTQIEEDLNNLRSCIKDLKGETKWYTARAGRDVKTLGTDLLDLEGKKLLFRTQVLTDITVPAAVAATGSIAAVAGSSLVDGEVFVLNDGVNPAVTFEFDDNASVVETATLRAVAFTSGDADTVVATTIRTAITNAPTLAITSGGSGANVTLTNDTTGAHGNIAITDTVAAGGFVVTGMAGGSGDIVVLSQAGGETPTVVAAVDAGTAAGAIVKVLTGDVGTWSSSAVTGANAINPKNLVLVRDSVSDDPILSGGKQVYGLIQAESGVVDGDSFNDTTKQAQISFVRESTTNPHTLERVPAADMAGKSIDYAYTQRVALDNIPEQAFLAGAFIDQAASVDVTLDNAVDNQSGPVTQTQHIDWRINDTYTLEFKDSTGTDILFGLVPNSGDDIAQFKVDHFNVVNTNAADFSNGVKVDTGGTTISIGDTAGVISSAGKLDLQSASATDLSLLAGAYLNFSDQYKAGSTYSTNLVLADSSAEWSAFETKFGEVSLLSAITSAGSHGKTVGVVTAATIAADTNVTGNGGGANIDAQLGDYSTRTFTNDVDVYLNGVLLRNGANSAANHDVYPGTTPANGDLKFEFHLKINDVITMVIY